MDFIMSNTMPGLARSATPELRRPQPTRAESHERPGYRLFPPAARAQKQTTAATPQQDLLRVAPTHGRRSFSLDDSRRGNSSGAPAIRHASPPRKGSAVRLDRDAVSILTYTGGSKDQDAPRALPFKLRGYKPRLIEDVNHARSTSAPLNVLERTRNQPSVVTIVASNHGRTATEGGSPVPVLPKQRERVRRIDIEKPLPPPPTDSTLHARADSPLAAPSIDSALDLTIRTISPSWTLLSDNDTYSSLSEDAKVRELMGIPTPDLSSVGGSLASSRASSPTSAMVESVDSVLSAMETRTIADVVEIPVEVSPARTMTITRKAVPGLQHKSSEMTLLPKAYTSPALIKKSSPKTAHSMDQQELIPPALKLGPSRPMALENENLTATADATLGPVTMSTKILHITPDISEPLQTLQDLADQSATVFARYDALRAERRELSNAISSCLREEQAGPNYTNVLLDQQMSLSTISSSMDVCLAKLKALEKRRVACVADIATLSSAARPRSIRSDNLDSPDAVSTAKRVASPSMTATGIISMYGARQRASSDVERRSTGLNIRVPSQRYEYPEMMQARILNVDESHDSQVISVRRADVKGVKAIKVSHKVAQSVNGSIFTPQGKVNGLAYDHFISTSPNSPPPDRPLPQPPVNAAPFRPSQPKMQKCIVAPAEHRILAPVVHDANATALYESDEEHDDPQWPLAEDFKLRSVKSQCSSHKSTQTVHVYLSPEPMPYPPLPGYAHEREGAYAQAW